jgi:hypothetical protein
MIPDIVLSQKDEVIRVLLSCELVFLFLGCHIDLAADDGLYPGIFSFEVECDYAVESPVIGDGQAIHAHLFGSVDEMRDAAHAIKETVFSVDVKVSKHEPELL